MIGIGLKLGGPEIRGNPIERVLTSLMRAVADCRDENYKIRGEGLVNPIFFVPGSIVTPNFEGMRIAKVSKIQKGVIVDISVPSDIDNEQDAVDYSLAALRRAVAMGAPLLEEKAILYPRSASERILNEAESILRESFPVNPEGS